MILLVLIVTGRFCREGCCGLLNAQAFSETDEEAYTSEEYRGLNDYQVYS